MSKTIVKFLPPEEVGEDQSGWWILNLDMNEDGTEAGCFDASGPYDTEEEAVRLAGPGLSCQEQVAPNFAQ
ncbi:MULTISPECIES: hypothetical protein [unclassified Bradyrhizobium]|uniref:hypothetical protein n=1 Tax=unclassified Bradyrhizobium TaxID=2631580 RepID=UPI0029166F9B|nr:MULTISPECIES: hypothetical protein [unclassified Bradyrhizobium]